MTTTKTRTIAGHSLTYDMKVLFEAMSLFNASVSASILGAACRCPDCDESQSDGHGYDDGESAAGFCYACELAGCTSTYALCHPPHIRTPCKRQHVEDNQGRCHYCGKPINPDSWIAHFGGTIGDFYASVDAWENRTD